MKSKKTNAEPTGTRRNFLKIVAAGTAALYMLPFTMHGKGQGEKPNFVLILADDLGYGDIGCYGNKVNRTPHLDRLAAEGIRFTDFHSNGPMCTPTRVALLTGLYQQRFGRKFEGALSGKAQYNEGLPLEAVTIAEELEQEGYATGMYGKWHMGFHPPLVPTRQGFDDYRGLLGGGGDHHSHIDRSGREDWWHNEQIDMESGYSVDLITRHSIEFIEQCKDQPFFLYVPHQAIHFPWQGPDDPAYRVEGRDYSNDKWGRIEDKNDVSPYVQSMVEALDRSVGEIVATLKRLDLDRRTLVIFASDNGGYLHYGSSYHNISSNGQLRGQKGDLYEGGHRVPAIACWPGRIQSGTVTNQTTMTMDIFPTLLELVDAPETGNAEFDGTSILPLLLENKPLPERTLFWRMRQQKAVRRGPWKLYLNKKIIELYNLDNDIGENNDLSKRHVEKVTTMQSELIAWEKEVLG
jgi:arylsulfatase A